VASGAVLVAFGIVVVVLAISGHNTVTSELKQQKITGTPDMTPTTIATEAKQANLPSGIPLPTCSVAGETVDTGSEARCFAQYMQIHAYEATGGLTYAQMPRYASADGKGTNDAATATQLNGQPVSNPARNIWVTETALATALNTSYVATQLSLFSLVVGIALILAGIGFGVLALGATAPTSKGPE
jgi:hypothetical protein